MVVDFVVKLSPNIDVFDFETLKARDIAVSLILAYLVTSQLRNPSIKL